MKPFTHLHVHSHFSLLNALPKIPELIEAAKKDGMKALALTDNCNTYGAIEFYEKCKKAEIKPILGIDAYVASRTRHDKEGRIDMSRSRLVLLAKNIEGYRNIIKLVTKAHLEGFYYKPRIDKELMSLYNENIICISPSFSGELSQALKTANIEKAQELLAYYRKTYGEENFFMEITHHPEIEGQAEHEKSIVDFAQKNNVPLVASHDVYYINKEDRDARETLMSVSSTFGGGRGIEGDDDFSFISQETANEYFKDIPGALENTQKIVDMCDIEIPLGVWKFPNYIVESGRTHDDELKHLAYEGLKRRKMELTDEVKTRIEYELEVIRTKGYSKYFLAVYDLLRFAKENQILSNTRGSAAGSLVSYLVGITIVDPIALRLPFERFLNPDRPSAPDIDMDFADADRDKVIEYAREKYGRDKVAQIGTFGTMLARGSVRDVARAMNFDYEIGDKIAKLIPMGSQGFPMTLKRALEEVPELQELVNKDKDVKTIVDMAKKIEGCARHIGVHAAGVVISPDPLDVDVAVQFDPKGEGKLITQYDMHAVGEDGVGLLKFDFLGLKNLTIIGNTIKLAKKVLNEDIDVDLIPLDDTKTYEMLARGETIATFQLNGSGMTRFLKELKPSNIDDINSMVALYRPGPMAFIPDYIERKHDPSKVSYFDEKLKQFLEPTYGILIYQDDILLIAVHIAGYTWGEADKFRKAVGKKIPEEMKKQKSKFIDGCVNIGGMTKENTKKLWDMIETFAAYGFNKCLTGDTRIVNSKTGEYKSINELYSAKQKLPTLSLDKDYKVVPQTTKDIVENGIKQIYTLKTRSGKEIKATNNHPFLKYEGWVNLENLKIGDRIATARALPIKINKKDELFKGAVLGYLISEGNLCHPHGLYFYSKSKDEIDDFLKFGKQFENTKFSFNYRRGITEVYVGQENQKNGNSMYKWLKELDLIDKKAIDKNIPQFIFTASQKTQQIFIAKLWQGDGCINLKGVQVFYATSSKKLANDLSHLLLRFGILNTIHTKRFKYRESIKIGYTIVVSHRDMLIKFYKEFGSFFVGKKKDDLKKLYQSSKLIIETHGNYPKRGTKDTVPVDIYEDIRIAMDEKNISAKDLAEKLGIAPRLLFKNKEKKGYQRALIHKLAVYLKSETLKKQSQSDIFWDEVSEIKKEKKEMTYDLEMPTHHNFVANDFIVHNSHAASYGRIAYLTSYFKANYTVFYMASVLTADQGDMEKVGEMVAECRRIGIEVLPPDINESFEDFATVGTENKIRFGLTTIKNFGEGIAHSIIDERKERGPFKNMDDFLTRVTTKNLNKKSLDALIKAGALDAFGERGQLMENMEDMLAYNKTIANGPKDQGNLFGDNTDMNDLHLRDCEPMSMDQKLIWEKELLGLYVSGNPLDKFKDQFDKRDSDIAKVKAEGKEEESVVVAGIVEDVRVIRTKRGAEMAFMKLRDYSDVIEVVVFPKVYDLFKNSTETDKCLAIKGKVSKRNDETSILAERIKKLVKTED